MKWKMSRLLWISSAKIEELSRTVLIFNPELFVKLNPF
jgi:hypothetical protein